MKDHEIAQLVNELTKIAKEYGQTQQCRDRISYLVTPICKKIVDLSRQNSDYGWMINPDRMGS